MKKLEKLVRPHFLKLNPYSSARDDYSGKIGIFLDANENPYGSVTDELFNRYPDPRQHAIKKQLAGIKNTDAGRIFLGNGSDEPIDLIIRLFCSPGEDNIIVLPPTYDMYQVAATINNNQVIRVPLSMDFDIDTDRILNAVNEHTKLIFICSPNNPTGNSMSADRILHILDHFNGIVVVDEAYIDFSEHESMLARLTEYPNLIILQTLSKAWGLAGLRLGIAYAIPELIELLNRIKSPYNINEATQQLVYRALQNPSKKDEMVGRILAQRRWLESELSKIRYIEKIYTSDSNFLLVRFPDANAIFDYLLKNRVIVRNRTKMVHCENTLRITAGKEEENAKLIACLQSYPEIQ